MNRIERLEARIARMEAAGRDDIKEKLERVLSRIQYRNNEE